MKTWLGKKALVKGDWVYCTGVCNIEARPIGQIFVGCGYLGEPLEIDGYCDYITDLDIRNNKVCGYRVGKEPCYWPTLCVRKMTKKEISDLDRNYRIVNYNKP